MPENCQPFQAAIISPDINLIFPESYSQYTNMIRREKYIGLKDLLDTFPAAALLGYWDNGKWSKASKAPLLPVRIERIVAL
ncbi:MAG: hypothetical protein AABZ18_02470 [Pseudomonadota bacterium]